MTRVAHPIGRSTTAAFLVTMLAAFWMAPSVRAAPPFGLDHTYELRPGAPIQPDDWITIRTVHGPRGFPCTANFVFADDAGNRYIGTAGHCAPVDEDGIYTWAYPDGPAGILGDGSAKAPGTEIGHFVYAALEYFDPDLPDPFIGIDAYPVYDLALIRLDPGVEVNPQMAHFGGPTGINTDLTTAPVVLHQFGWGAAGTPLAGGIATEIPVHARTFVAPSMSDRDRVTMLGVAAGGDSGSPVISHDGRAVGVLVSANYTHHNVGTDGVETGTDVVVRIGPQIEHAERVLGINLTLLTAPRL